MAGDKNEYILSINGMSKSFGRNKVLKHISLNVKPGSIMGLMGENGAGKSTMMKCLFGTYQKDEGTIILDGKEVNFSGPKEALENGVAMVHQELNQCLERSVVDNLFLGRYPKNSMGVVDEGRMKKEASDLFRKLGITVNMTQPMKKMSVSQRQMCEIAKAISYNSKVISCRCGSNLVDRCCTDRITSFGVLSSGGNLFSSERPTIAAISSFISVSLLSFVITRLPSRKTET